MSLNLPPVIFEVKGPQTCVEIKKMPCIPGLFAKMICLAMLRPSGLSPDTMLKNTCMVFKNHPLDLAKINQFKTICGYGSSQETDKAPAVPAPYIQTLFIGVLSRFISSSYFPINPMGLIQVGQSFELKRPIGLEESLNLYCSLLDMTQTEKGIHTRFHLEATSSIKSRGEVVWQGISTYFTRAKAMPKTKKKKNPEETPLEVVETIQVPRNTGLKYAAVSGDYNPHHLYGWTAKFIGFKQPIAHGMWSLARAGASLEKRFGYPPTFQIQGSLKLPIFMPAAITLGVKAEATRVHFELRDQEKSLPHLKGTFSL